MKEKTDPNKKKRKKVVVVVPVEPVNMLDMSLEYPYINNPPKENCI